MERNSWEKSIKLAYYVSSYVARFGGSDAEYLVSAALVQGEYQMGPRSGMYDDENLWFPLSIEPGLSVIQSVAWS